MAAMKSKSIKQLQKNEYEYYACENCKWSEMTTEWCRKQDCSVHYTHCCHNFEAKQGKRNCIKCKHYNSRSNATTYCKIGIYNCKGVVK